jgi:hypothetical protein
MFRCWQRGWNGGEEVAETTLKRPLCCGFRRDGTSVSMLMEDMSGNICFSPKFEYHVFYVLYPFVTWLSHVNRLRPGRPWNRDWFSSSSGDFSLIHSVQTHPGAHLAPLSNECSSMAKKRPVCEADDSPPCGAEFNAPWISTFTPPYDFIARYLIKHGDDFTVNIHVSLFSVALEPCLHFTDWHKTWLLLAAVSMNSTILGM